MQEIQVRSLGRKDPLGKGMATHFSALGWRIPWTEEPGGLQSMGSQLGRTERLTLSLSFPLLKETAGSFPAPKPASSQILSLHPSPLPAGPPRPQLQSQSLSRLWIHPVPGQGGAGGFCSALRDLNTKRIQAAFQLQRL